eukprot:TRINITY_DN663_c2_g1_i1.p1 TRINITY_DN663_c2_g1~~TRINITY_DN663_c2_g1_i1.p1  ORF type:complete len:119 (+),score=25.14 TRINITY_DN663_c2_g1_i1:55-411(+)
MDILNNILPVTKAHDFVGQSMSYTYFRIILNTAGVIGFVLGYIKEDFNYTIGIVLVATLAACLICVPPWPCFHSHPLPWKDSETLKIQDQHQHQHQNKHQQQETKPNTNNPKKKKPKT